MRSIVQSKVQSIEGGSHRFSRGFGCAPAYGRTPNRLTALVARSMRGRLGVLGVLGVLGLLPLLVALLSAQVWSQPVSQPVNQPNLSANGTTVDIAAIRSSVSRSRPAQELLVRFRTPQDTREQAQSTVRRVFQAAHLTLDRDGYQVTVIAGPQGVIRLRVGAQVDVTRVRDALMRSDEVLNTTSNHLYLPALHLVSRPARTSTQPRPGSRPRRSGRPFFGPLNPRDAAILLNGLPEILPAPALVPGPDPYESQDWALSAIRMPSADEMADLLRPKEAPSDFPRSVVAAVIDTGFDYNHEDLSGAWWRDPQDPTRVGYDFAHDHPYPYDVVKFDMDGCMTDNRCAWGLDQSAYLVNPGHGTHCAGHVGAVAGNSVGIRGVGAPVQVMALKFFNDPGEQNAGHGDDAAGIRAIDYAIARGAKVINASWGIPMTPEEAERSELRAAVLRARDAGVLIVVAAGNETIDQDAHPTPSYPARYDIDNILTVAAVDPSDALAEFSNFGLKSVHLAAPGVRIFSTTAGNSYSDVIVRYMGFDGSPQEVQWEGTSMAAPLVAGAAAALWAVHPEADYRTIKSILLKTVRPVEGLQGKVLTGGVLDVRSALGI